MKTVIINSKLYGVLFEAGDDRLVSVYATVKSVKRGKNVIEAYKAKNGRIVGGYSLLRRKTKLSLSVLKKYIPQLINLGLIEFSQGNIHLLGNNKLNQQYKTKKFVPITIGHNFCQTQMFSYYVRVCSMEGRQKNAIDKKFERIKIKAQAEKRGFLTPKQWKIYKNTQSSHLENFVDKVILSNEGFCKLKSGEEDNRSKGCYYKRKLVKNKLIKSIRRKEFIKTATIQEYRFLKRIDKTLTYYNGKIFKELTAEFRALTEYKEEKVEKQESKPLAHLSFDFIHWLENSI